MADVIVCILQISLGSDGPLVEKPSLNHQPHIFKAGPALKAIATDKVLVEGLGPSRFWLRFADFTSGEEAFEAVNL